MNFDENRLNILPPWNELLKIPVKTCVFQLGRLSTNPKPILSPITRNKIPQKFT